MCICAIAWQILPNKPLVLLANRDEFFERPTAPLRHWDNTPIVAGQDLMAGGTWLGINSNNQKWAVILNFREIIKDKPHFITSRGQIISEYLQSQMSPLSYAKSLNLMEFDGFNLIVGDRTQAVMLNNKGFPITVLSSGLYTVSNGQPESLDKAESWFKTEHLRRRVRQEILPLIAQNAPQQDWVNASFNVLADTTQASVERLPDTGLSKVAEMALSSIFIPNDRLDTLFDQKYGTRCSSVLWLERESFRFYEKTFTDNDAFLTHFSQ